MTDFTLEWVIDQDTVATIPGGIVTLPDIYGTGATGTWNINITGLSAGAPPLGAAGGDLSGTYPSPTVAKINGNPLGTTTPTYGNLLYGTGTQWDILLGNSSSAPLVLTSVGNGTASTSLSWQPLPVTGTLVYYLTNTVSDVVTDYKQIVTPIPALTSIVVTGLTNGQLITTWVTDPNNPNRTSLPDGQYSNHIHAAKTGGTKDLQIRTEIWEVTSAGVDIAKIADLGPSTLLSGSNTEYFIADSVPEYTTASTTSRIATKLYAVVGASGSAPDITVYIGDGSDSRTNLPAVSVDATNFVPYVGSTANVDLGIFSLTATGINDTNLTASQLVASDASKNLVSGNLSGDVTSSQFVTTLATVNSNVGSFGSATQVGTFTVNAKGLITAASNVTISGTAPGGSAGGDLSGTYPNPTVSKINGATLGTTTATSGNLLIGSGTSWVTNSMSGDITINSTGVTAIGALKVTNSMIANTTIDLTTKVTGILPNANTTATAANTASTIVLRDASNNFSAGTITAALSGNATTATTATNATNTAITDDTTTNASMLLTWVTTNTGNLPQKVTSTKLTFNPSTGTLASTTFSGAFSGTATNATNIGITNDTTTNASMFPVWVTANTGNLPAKVSSTKLSFNPSTGLLNIASLTASQAVVSDASKNLTSLAYSTTNTASALVQRDASGYMFSTGLTMAKNGTITVTDFLLMGDTSQALNTKYWGSGPSGTSLLFYTVNDAFTSSTNWLTVARSGNTISSVNFSSSATFNVTGTVNLTSLTASQAVVTDASKNLASLAYTSANTVSTLVLRDGSGNFSAGTITAALTGNATTATTATNATNIGITDDTTTNSSMNLVWVTSNTGNLPAKTTSTKLNFNPSTGTLTATAFSGSINTATEASDTTCFPVFVTASGTQSLPLKTNTGFTFNAVNSALGVGPLTASSVTVGSLITAAIYARVEWDMSTASPTIRSSMNVSSISDNGVGKNGVNMTNAMADANYTVLCFVRNEIAGGDMACNLEQGQVPTSSAFRMASGRAGTGFVDSVYANAIVVY